MRHFQLFAVAYTLCPLWRMCPGRVSGPRTHTLHWQCLNTMCVTVVLQSSCMLLSTAAVRPPVLLVPLLLASLAAVTYCFVQQGVTACCVLNTVPLAALGNSGPRQLTQLGGWPVCCRHVGAFVFRAWLLRPLRLLLGTATTVECRLSGGVCLWGPAVWRGVWAQPIGPMCSSDCLGWCLTKVLLRRCLTQIRSPSKASTLYHGVWLG
jgi:hypothetical protein